MRYVWAATLVALGLLIGFILEPAFGRSQAYATFYPVVMIAAYGLGPRPAVATALLSAAVAYWCFIPPAFQWKWDSEVGAALGFFLGTSALAIYLITRLVHALANLPARGAKAAEMARVNAVIFADLAARNDHSLAPVAAPAASRPVMAPARSAPVVRPSERSFDIARLDREAPDAKATPTERPVSRKPETTPAGQISTLH